MELAPLPDRTLRRRSVRDAFASGWVWLAQADTLSVLARVTVPVLVVHADGLFHGAPYLELEGRHWWPSARETER